MKIQREFSLVKQGWNSVYAFAPELELCESEQFPAADILSHLDVRKEHLISMETLASGKPQEFARVLRDFMPLAFAGLGKCDDHRSALSIENQIRPSDVAKQDNELQIIASNDETYFMANISLIREALEDMSSIQSNDIEPLAEALQKALVSYGVQNGHPVMFAMSLIEEADKPVMYQADRYIWKKKRALEIGAAREQILAAE